MVKYTYRLQNKNLDLNYHLFPPVKPINNESIFCNIPIIRDFIDVMSNGIYFPYSKDNKRYLSAYLILYTLVNGEPATIDDARKLMQKRQAIYSNIKIIPEHRPSSVVTIDPVHWIPKDIKESLKNIDIDVEIPSRREMIYEAVNYAPNHTLFIISEQNIETHRIRKILNNIFILERVTEFCYKKVDENKYKYFVGYLK